MYTHRNSGPLFAVLLTWVLLFCPVSELSAGVPGAVGDLYVTSDALNVVGQYDWLTGVKQHDFAISAGGPVGQLGVHYGGTNNNLLVGHWDFGVIEFDGNTGAHIRTYAPGGGFQWAGVWAPNGNVYIGSQVTNDVREYDSSTGAPIRVLTSVEMPTDMEYGPNGNLYICSMMSYVKEVDPITGALVSQWTVPGQGAPNDIAFLENEILVTEMTYSVVVRFDYAHNYLGTFSGTGWGNTHGIAISPHDGNVYVVDGISTQVHIFDPVTYTELDAAFLNPNPAAKVVDLAFKPSPAAVGTISALNTCIPASGTVPFASVMTVTLVNNYADQSRRIAGHIDSTLASGSFFSSWRAGYTNVAAGGSYVASWSTTFPALGTLVGNNLFLLVAEDVTPTPYNQPPYPASGDTDSASCTVTGVAP